MIKTIVYNNDDNDDIGYVMGPMAGANGCVSESNPYLSGGSLANLHLKPNKLWSNWDNHPKYIVEHDAHVPSRIKRPSPL